MENEFNMLTKRTCLGLLVVIVAGLYLRFELIPEEKMREAILYQNVYTALQKESFANEKYIRIRSTWSLSATISLSNESYDDTKQFVKKVQLQNGQFGKYKVNPKRPGPPYDYYQNKDIGYRQWHLSNNRYNLSIIEKERNHLSVEISDYLVERKERW